MSSSPQAFTLKIPANRVLNAAGIVLQDEKASVITLDKFLLANVTYEYSDAFDISLDIKNIENYSFLGTDLYSWTRHIVSTTLEFLEVENISINILAQFDDGFFLENMVETGLGATSCLTICVIYSLYEILKLNGVLTDMPIQDFRYFTRFLFTVHQYVLPEKSGCNVMSSCIGPMNFFIMGFTTLLLTDYYILLGTFGHASSTQKILDLSSMINSDKLKSINILITEKLNMLAQNQNSNELSDDALHERKIVIKRLYEDYLDELRNLSHNIVPDRQYEILKNTSKFDILGCGVSLAGGEDTVWCLTKDIEAVKDYWDKEFPYVITSKLLPHGTSKIFTSEN
ncbi:mevalonate kinase [Vairimorpha necatrix]|uniref:Mevalonate kinase n=1 Tax=Vairimorpha necatrix TaxID=6039 RepID=A0AAX4J9X4_9MICR